jgi:hypothetical protein
MLAFRSAALLIALAVLGACSSSTAFVDRREMERSVKKPKLPGYTGQVTVCYDGATSRQERDRLATEACEVYGLKAMLSDEVKWQCRLTTPHTANYHCYDPDMRMADGGLVNPFSNSQVKAWRRERSAATAREPAPAQE